MTTTLAQMTQEEFEVLLSDILEKKILELLVDPDKGQSLQLNLQERLVQQQKMTVQGERGQSLHEVITQLGL
jgi:hypothetical protein